MKNFLFLALSLLFCSSCISEKQIRAKIWRGGNNEIVRDLNENQEEFLLTNDPKFLDFRCIEKHDLERIIKEALKQCDDANDLRSSLEKLRM